MSPQFSKIVVFCGITLAGCAPSYHQENASAPVTIRKRIDWSSGSVGSPRGVPAESAVGTGNTPPARSTLDSRRYDDLQRRY